MNRKHLMSWIGAFAALGVIALAAAISACGGGGGAGASPQDRFNTELKALQHKDWKTVYNIASPRVRADCSYGDFLSAIQAAFALSSLDVSKVGYKDVSVSTNGDTATITYTTTYDGQAADENSSNPDQWVKVNGTWYDDNKGESGCGTSGD